MRLLVPFTALVISIATSGLGAAPAQAQGSKFPWGQSSDMAAWETFVQITAPSGNPNTTNVEFETWASDQDIYNLNPKWPDVTAPKQLLISALGNARHGNRVVQAIQPGTCTQNFNREAAQAAGFPLDGCIGEEVRRNWATFQYLVSNKLNTAAGLGEAFAKNFKVDLPADAIEFKGDWVRVDDLKKWLKLSDQQVRQYYYTNKVKETSGLTEYALVAFHFSTKQIKNWVWADFEHQKNPGRCDYIGCHDSFGAAEANVTPRKPFEQQYGECKKTAALLAMFTNAGTNPVWQNYCLKGSQITFVKDGKPVLLGNSVIEQINANVPILQSSCMSCHQYASFNASGEANFDALNPNKNKHLIGDPDPNVLKGYVTNDFLWGNLGAP